MDKNEIGISFYAEQDFISVEACLPVNLDLAIDQRKKMEAELKAAMLQALAPYCIK